MGKLERKLSSSQMIILGFAAVIFGGLCDRTCGL